jgi:hypothetical protein
LPEVKSDVFLTIGVVALLAFAWDELILPTICGLPATNPAGTLCTTFDTPISGYTGLSDTWMLVIGVGFVALSFFEFV